MKLRKIVPVAAISMMLVSSSFPLNVSAKNNTDSSFRYWVNSSSSTMSDFRPKEDRSAPYCHLQEAPASGFNMRIYTLDNSLRPYSLQDGTQGDAIMYAGQKRRIKCYVMDVGRKYCAIGAKYRGSIGYAVGVWSPDSLGTYTYAN